MDSYIETLLKNTKSSEASMSILNWFNKFEEFNNFILSHDSDSILSKLTKQSIDWEKFTAETVELELAKLNKETTNVFWNKVSNFIDLIRSCLDENLPLDQVYHLLDVLVAISSETSRLEISEDLQKTIDSCVSSCYSNIISSVEFQLPDNYMGTLKHNELDESQIIPSMALTRLILQLCRNFLSANGQVSNQQYGKLFLNKYTRSAFVSLKNEMLSKIITKAVSDFVSMSTHKEETDDKDKLKDELKNELNDELKDVLKDELMTESKSVNDEHISEDNNIDVLKPHEVEKQSSTRQTEDHQLARGFVVDIAYVLLFTKPEIKNDNEIIQQILSKVNNDRTMIDDLALTILLKSVHDFYNSTKGIYLPLLYN
jgi:hypothetical protein